ncbi:MULTISPECIES: Atu4866 domain-containing protein [Streptomyces]|uniref:Atu4866 domain-containing protein n=1 Tax=Streptomyces sp. B15 TaxID=1537797 RepID=UPI0027DDEFC3|nr:Atu4866 domain-containing protein [Streptomyces sp. B15]
MHPELLPDGRYDEARGARRSSATSTSYSTGSTSRRDAAVNGSQRQPAAASSNEKRETRTLP